LWIADHGGRLNTSLAIYIDYELDRLYSFEVAEKSEELEKIRTRSPQAIPRPALRPVWALILAGKLKSDQDYFNIYDWLKKLKRDGLTTTLRLKFRNLLSPRIEIKKPFRFSDDIEDLSSSEDLNDLIDWNLILSTDHVNHILKDLKEKKYLEESLPDLLPEIQQLLIDALDISRQLGKASNQNDDSYWDLPSISPHRQNQFFRDWVVLIELLRNSWLRIFAADPQKAKSIAKNWYTIPYPTFKRLALYAASQGCIDTDLWVQWLISEDAWWLWSICTQRETMRLLVLQGNKLNQELQGKLETAILEGPPRVMYSENLTPEEWVDSVDHAVWLCLSKLKLSRTELGDDAAKRLNSISSKKPKWQIAENESDEFSHWMSGSGEPDFEKSRTTVSAPRDKKELVQWLKTSKPSNSPLYRDDWGEICTNEVDLAVSALQELSKEDEWPSERWREAINIWSRDEQLKRVWDRITPLIITMPDQMLQEIAHSLSHWLEVVSKVIEDHEDLFISICHKLIGLPLQDGVQTDEPVTRAINHPVGRATQGLINLWFRQKLNDNDLLPKEIEAFFTRLCDRNVKQFIHGRVILASRLITLFRVDKSWTETNLLPFFNWENDFSEAKAAWEGFLWSPRLYQPLLISFKIDFLNTANYYTELGKRAEMFVSFLTYAALDITENYTKEDYVKAFRILPEDGLIESAHALVRALEGAGDQKEDYWTNRVKPFWQNIWPKNRKFASEKLSEILARLCISAGFIFPDALETVYDWLLPIERPFFVVSRMKEKNLCKQFPEDALKLLDAITEEPRWGISELKECLIDIEQACPEMEQDTRYKKLQQCLRVNGLV
jgi:hypothetical protein